MVEDDVVQEDVYLLTPDESPGRETYSDSREEYCNDPNYQVDDIYRLLMNLLCIRHKVINIKESNFLETGIVKVD